MIEPKVSICVPVYGVEAFIERCAVSLFEQSYNNIEYIFVNDCTKDNSIGILRSVLQRYSHRVSQTKIISHDINKGSASTRNTLLDNVTGDFVIWVDSDDYIESNLVADVVKKQQETDADVVCYGYTFHKGKAVDIILPHVSTLDKWAYDALARNTSIVLWDKLVKTSIYRIYNLRFIDGLNMGEDYYIVPQILYYAKNIVVLRKPLYNYSIALNANSYCSSCDVITMRQMITNLDLLHNIFIGKGEKYEEAYRIAESRVIANNLVFLCSVSELYDNYYKYLRDRANKVNLVYWHYVKKEHRFVFIITNYTILRFLVRNIKKIRFYL